MDQGLLPRRYAKALYKYAVERHCDKALYDAMQRLAQAFADNAGLQHAVANPFVDAAQKKTLILTAASPNGDARQALEAFIDLLVANKRIALMRDAALAYIKLYRHENRIFEVTVTSAAPLTDADRTRMRRMIDAHLAQGATAEFTFDVDPALIGGFTVNIDNERLDASVRNDLEQLRQAFAN